MSKKSYIPLKTGPKKNQNPFKFKHLTFHHTKTTSDLPSWNKQKKKPSPKSYNRISFKEHWKQRTIKITQIDKIKLLTTFHQIKSDNFMLDSSTLTCMHTTNEQGAAELCKPYIISQKKHYRRKKNIEFQKLI